jgi:hypothetical protein
MREIGATSILVPLSAADCREIRTESGFEGLLPAVEARDASVIEVALAFAAVNLGVGFGQQVGKRVVDAVELAAVRLRERLKGPPGEGSGNDSTAVVAVRLTYGSTTAECVLADSDPELGGWRKSIEGLGVVAESLASTSADAADGRLETWSWNGERWEYVSSI